MGFRDHFSRRPGEYARYRPRYPGRLYQALADVAPAPRFAWDCATGSGQAAVGLAEHFRFVLATDASPEQLTHAESHDRVGYAVAYAESAPARDHTFDLLSVAAAAHWFDLDPFYAEVRRVVRPGGVLAMWSYFTFTSEAAIDEVMARYTDEVVGGFWPERFHYNRNRYVELPFPFERIDLPPFHTQADWDLEELLGFVDTWSATQRYQETRGNHPFEEIIDDLRHAWGDPIRRVRLRWPLAMLAGRV